MNVFTYILKGWTDDAINELGIDESLRELVLNLWAQYLSITGRAFLQPDQTTSLGIEPSFRDLQVEVTGRKRLLTPKEISNYVRKRNEQGKDIVKDDIDYFSDDSTESRRRRNKVKRKFLSSFASETSSVADTSSASFLTSEEESIYSDIDSEHEEIMDVHKEIISRMTSKSQKSLDPKRMTPERLRLKVVYALFCYGILLMENNAYTLSDLIRFAQNGVIAYSTGVQHVPGVMKLDMPFDIAKFSGINQFQRNLDHLKMRRLMNNLGELIQLEEVDLGTEFMTVQSVIKRYLKEFSLPKSLANLLYKSLQHSGLYELKWKFKTYQTEKTKSLVEPEPLVSSDLRAIAIILFALKYLYGLDDVSEFRYSGREDSFDLIEWIDLSKDRAYLACRFSVDLNSNLKNMFQNQVKLTRAAYYIAMKERRTMISEFQNTKRVEGGKRDWRYYSEEKRSLKNVIQVFKINPLKKKMQDCKVNNFQCKTSLTPLNKFAKYYSKHAKLDTNEEKPSIQYIRKLERLLEMHKLKLNRKKADPTSQNIEVNPSFIMAMTPSSTHVGKDDEAKNVFSSEKELNVDPNQRYNFKPVYWRNRRIMGNKGSAESEGHHSKEYNSYFLSTFPENFAWILQYFAATLNLRPTEIYFELLHVESTLLQNDKTYFGELIRSVTEYSTMKTVVSEKYKEKLSF